MLRSTTLRKMYLLDFLLFALLFLITCNFDRFLCSIFIFTSVFFMLPLVVFFHFKHSYYIVLLVVIFLGITAISFTDLSLKISSFMFFTLIRACPVCLGVCFLCVVVSLMIFLTFVLLHFGMLAIYCFYA